MWPIQGFPTKINDGRTRGSVQGRWSFIEMLCYQKKDIKVQLFVCAIFVLISVINYPLHLLPTKINRSINFALRSSYAIKLAKLALDHMDIIYFIFMYSRGLSIIIYTFFLDNKSQRFEDMGPYCRCDGRKIWGKEDVRE